MARTVAPSRRKMKTRTVSKALQPRRSSRSKPMKRRAKPVAATETTMAEVLEIVDERVRPTANGKANGRSTSKTQPVTQYRCSWMDGAPDQWLDECDLANTQALYDWQTREDVVAEQRESAKVVLEKSTLLASWLKTSKRPVFYTGAGISASVLPTFRGKNGLWTKDAHKYVSPNKPVVPTFGHRAIAALERAGFVYFLVTQNYDGLSGKSGFPPLKQSELHGNIFLEACDKCGHEYYRDFEVPLESSVHHETGRWCEQPDCGGTLRDNIVHFEEALPWHALKMANAKSTGADLSIAIGTSLRVEPAASMPFKSSRRNRQRSGGRPHAVIINLQPTPFDDEADLVIRGDIDQVLGHVVAALGVDVPAV
eukprot:m.1479569 g.1479569  ORF g.1479569 m.1479569 type:complete len:368 (-) comp25171_c0_seq3:136-1239(-)